MRAIPILRLSVLVLAASLAGPVLAQKPEWAGGGNGGGGGKGKAEHKHEGKHAGKGEGKSEGKQAGKNEGKGARQGSPQVRVGAYFSDQQRNAARTSYVQAYGGEAVRSCPPGLAKKNNGCMPPGQAKKYQLGQPLPSSVVYYPVPGAILVQLPPAPVGHKYVRVAADILLIAVGSSMVIDAISDLSRL
jgi:hypothetical protein